MYAEEYAQLPVAPGYLSVGDVAARDGVPTEAV